MTNAPEPTPEQIKAELAAELAEMRAKDAAREASEGQSWDAFWAEVHGPVETATIRGVTVQVPRDLPLSFEYRASATRDSSRQEDHKALLKDLFGVDVLDAWVDAGMGAIEFQVVLFWAVSHGRGKPISFREAYEQVLGMERGKAEAARTRTGDESAATGGRSKRTSPGSTASRRRTSPA